MAELYKRIETYSSKPTIRYRVWNAINPPAIMDYYTVEIPEEAAKFIKEESTKQLEDSQISINAFGLEEYDPLYGTWSEWCSDNGEDIDNLVEELEELEL